MSSNGNGAVLNTIVQALANQIRDVISDPAGPAALLDLQVEPIRLLNPTPPCIDIYPGNPFQEQTTMQRGGFAIFFVVRARVSIAEHEGGQELLLDLMDPRSSESVSAAIASDRTLGGLVGSLNPEGPSGHILYEDVAGNGSLLGCEWLTRVVLP